MTLLKFFVYLRFVYSLVAVALFSETLETLGMGIGGECRFLEMCPRELYLSVPLSVVLCFLDVIMLTPLFCCPPSLPCVVLKLYTKLLFVPLLCLYKIFGYRNVKGPNIKHLF